MTRSSRIPLGAVRTDSLQDPFRRLAYRALLSVDTLPGARTAGARRPNNPPMTEPDRLGVATAALDLIPLHPREPARVLVELAEAVSATLGVAAGGSLLPESADGVVFAGPETARAAVIAGFDIGPGSECASSGRPVDSPRLDRERPRWLAFVAKATMAGVTAAWALPIRRGPEQLGALLLLGDEAAAPDLRVAAVLTDAAAVAVLHAREMDRVEQEVRQLRAALQSRVVVEHATGMVAEHAGLGLDEAFALLRGHARRNRRSLVDVSSGVVQRHIDPAAVVGPL